MEARAHGAMRAVPWESWQLWNEVQEAVFSSSPDCVCAALNKIAAWRARNSLPVAVEVTWDLISIQRADPYYMECRGISCLDDSLSNELLSLMYAMALMRLINGIVDHSKQQSSLSVADRAEAAGLPRMLVDIRHEVAHWELPSLPYLRLASKEALDWLKVHYWEAQKQVLDNAHTHLHDKLRSLASTSDVSENKVLGARKRFLVLRAKKLAKLSVPAVNLFEECDTNDISVESMEGETAKEKSKDFLCSDDAVDAELQNSQFELSKARKRLLSLCGNGGKIEGTVSEAYVEESDETANTFSFDFSNGHKKMEIEHMKKKQSSSSKAGWAVADSWKPCAIGMLPSKVHPAGVLPFCGNLFPGVIAKEGTTCEVAKKLSNEAGAYASVKEAIKAAALMEIETKSLNCNSFEEGRDGSCRSKEGEIMCKRLKTVDTEAPKVNGEDLCPLDSQLHSSKHLKVELNGHPLSGKCKASLSAGGFLLLEGMYQRCGVAKLAAIRSSIQILK